MLKPPFHSFEARTCRPFKQRGLHPATLQGRTRASRMGPGRPTCTFTQTHTELSVLLTYTICCAKHLESRSEGACHNSQNGREESRTQQTWSEIKCPHNHIIKLCRSVLVWDLNTVIWGHWEKIFFYIYTYTHMTH